MMTQSWQQHEGKVDSIQKQVERAAREGRCLERGRDSSQVSHVTRGTIPTTKGTSFRALNQVVEIDVAGKSAWVEPGVTMEQLASACLSQGLIPAVLPECKGITVGGAIMGAGLESGSYLHGQFNDLFTEYEVLLADGTLLRISPKSHPELFYGLAGSYGTLASLTCAKIGLASATQSIRLDYELVDGSDAFCTRVEAICKGTLRPDYLDGMVLVDGRIVVMQGWHVADDTPRSSLDHWWSPWFAQRVIDKVASNTLQSDIFSAYDYVFRYDRGGFWMGQFVTSPEALFRHLSEWHLAQPNLAEQLHRIYRKNPPTLKPGLLWRALMGWKLSTRSLYKVFHRLPEATRAHLYLVQDFYIPTDQVPTFISHLREHVGIFPLWLCPIRGTTTAQFLCPHHLKRASRYPQPDFVNVGVYGIPKGDSPVPEVVQGLETLANDLGGRKVLYSFNFYTEQRFWQVYDSNSYHSLRQRYGADGRLKNFYEKLHSQVLIYTPSAGNQR